MTMAERGDDTVIRVRDLARAHLLVLVGGRLVEVEDETAALQPVLAAVDADPRQPCLKRRALAKILQVLVGPQEALLRRAVRLARVAEEPVGDPRDPPLVTPDEVLEGLRLPGADLLDQAAFVDAGGCLTRNHREYWHR